MKMTFDVSRSTAFFAVLLVTSCAAIHTTTKLEAVSCAALPAATVTFNAASCTSIDVTLGSCWTPHAPTSSDVVAFPSTTIASMPYAYTYTPLVAQAVLVEAGANVTLFGGAVVVTGCLSVVGTLTLIADTVGYPDNGTTSTVAFPADPTVPSGTDCLKVSQGFTPRICGPGEVLVSGQLTLRGLYASLWAPTTVTSIGLLAFQHDAFLWGNVSNLGAVTGTGFVYLHGSLYNLAATSKATFNSFHVDYWTDSSVLPNVTVTMVNYGTLTFQDPKSPDNNFDFLSTMLDGYTSIVTLRIDNYANLYFICPVGVATTAQNLRINNYGTTSWHGPQSFYSGGYVYNAGTLVANEAHIYWLNLVSEGGKLRYLRGGTFNFGSGVGLLSQPRRPLGPFVATVQMRDTVIEFVGNRSESAGSVAVYSPIDITGGHVRVLPGAVLRNQMPFQTAVVQRGSTGSLIIGGRYECGTAELLDGAHSQFTVESDGVLRVPENSVLTVKSDANFRSVGHVDIHGTVEVELYTAKSAEPQSLSSLISGSAAGALSHQHTSSRAPVVVVHHLHGTLLVDLPETSTPVRIVNHATVRFTATSSIGHVDLDNYGAAIWGATMVMGTVLNHAGTLSVGSGVSVTVSRRATSYAGVMEVAYGGSLHFGVECEAAFVNTQLATKATEVMGGVVVAHRPIHVEGRLTVGAGITLRNEIPNRCSLTQAAVGHVVVKGRYEAGPVESLNAVSILSQGSLVVPKTSAASLATDAAVVMDAGAVMDVAGELSVAQTKTGEATTWRISPLSLLFGSDRVAGVETLPMMIVP